MKFRVVTATTVARRKINKVTTSFVHERWGQNAGNCSTCEFGGWASECYVFDVNYVNDLSVYHPSFYVLMAARILTVKLNLLKDKKQSILGWRFHPN